MKRKIYQTFSSLICQLIDFAVITVSIWIAYKLYRISGLGESVIYQKTDIIPVSMTMGLFVIVIMRFFKVYQINSSVMNVEEIQNTTKGLTSAFLLIMVILVFWKSCHIQVCHPFFIYYFHDAGYRLKDFFISHSILF